MTINTAAQSNSAVQSEHFKQKSLFAKQKYILELRESLLSEEEISFSADTFFYRHLFRLKMRETSICKRCIDENLYELISNYENMLSEYHNKLLSKLIPNDQILMKKEIALWQAYYDGTQQVLKKLSSDNYTKDNDIAASMNMNTRLKILEERLIYVSKNYFYLL